jgi:molybdopterin synthase catalytic subunit
LSVRVQHEDFDIGAEVARLTAGRTDIGAVVTFTGTVRSESGSAGIAGMTLEHYPGMTEEELARVEAEATQRWPLQASLIVHRVGTLEPGDNIVLVVTASAHRQAAFAAAEFLMDYLKTRLHAAAAVHLERDAGDHAALGRGEEQRGIRDVGGQRQAGSDPGLTPSTRRV